MENSSQTRRLAITLRFRQDVPYHSRRCYLTAGVGNKLETPIDRTEYLRRFSSPFLSIFVSAALFSVRFRRHSSLIESSARTCVATCLPSFLPRRNRRAVVIALAVPARIEAGQQ